MTIAKLVFILIPITSALLDSQTSKEESFDVVKTVVSEFINIQQVPHCKILEPFLQPQLIESHGYHVEEHEVITEDGYILTLHRIPPKKSLLSNEKRPPVFLGHCLVGSSAIWAFGPKHNSLAYILADAGKNQ